MYLLRAHLICHDVRLNTSIEMQVPLDHQPDEAEAIRLLAPLAEETVARNFCAGCLYGLDVTEIRAMDEKGERK